MLTYICISAVHMADEEEGAHGKGTGSCYKVAAGRKGLPSVPIQAIQVSRRKLAGPGHWDCSHSGSLHCLMSL